MPPLRRTLQRFLELLAILAIAPTASAGPLDEMSLERWAKLREVERYQLNIAEKYYRESQWKVAADEYEKFLKLYERSIGAPYAQLKWSFCQIQQRNLNTAIKDGFQTVIDYFPDSPEAVTSAYLIGRTCRDMGDLGAAKKAYEKVLKGHPKQYVAVLARVDLVDIASKEKDDTARVKLLRELTFDIERKGPAVNDCVAAARLLAQQCFSIGDFAEGIKALTTSCTEAELPAHLMHPSLGRLAHTVHDLTASAEEQIKKRGEKLADEGAVWLKTRVTETIKDEKTKPQAIQCWYHIADLRYYARQPEKQKEVYDQMLAALGPSDELLGRIAQWYKTAGKRDQARTTYLAYKDKIEGQRQIANSWIEENKFDQAVAIYRKLSLEDAANAPRHLSDAAYTFRRAGKPDQAIAIYNELITSDVKNAPTYHWEIAETLYHAARYKECITAYRGTEKFPTNYQRMAEAHRQLKQYDEAIALYRNIMAGHEPLASWALYQIGDTHEKAGRDQDAIKTFKLVCDRFPKTGEGSAAHAHLNQKYNIRVTLGGAKD